MLHRYIWIFIFLIFLLSSCAPIKHQNAFSRTHTQKSKHSYTVRGKTYRILKNSKNYSEVGKASWYSNAFHQRRTSSGERYNKNAMTAAHRTLPLNTYVNVKNLRNGKQVRVKINDRGPFAHSRLIDLSYAAAKKIGITKQGLGMVRVTTIS